MAADQCDAGRLAVGLIAAVAATLLVKATIRPDVVIALVVGVPIAIGMLMILFRGGAG